MLVDITKVLLPAIIAFVIGIMMTPAWASYLYHNKMWKKKAKTVSVDGGGTPLFNALHKEKEVGTPRLGGVIIWFSSLVTIVLVWIIARSTDFVFFDKLDFLSRDQTWIPLSTLLLGAMVGFIDDFLDIKGSGGHIAGGLSLRKRLGIVAFVSLLCGLWFYFKLDVVSIGLFGGSSLYLGWVFVPFFVLVTVALYSGGVIDGLDGLAGGLFAVMFGAYGAIAFYQTQFNLAAFCATIVGAILAFLWFNIPPARFYMSETGSMALTITLSVVAFMTDSLGDGHGIIVLPIIALLLVITTASVIIQVFSKKLRRGKKVFLISPLHHHFEALGWPAYKVTMRYWIVGVVSAVFGVIIGLIR